MIGATGTVKGDIEFGNNLKTENGADIDGYIKTNKSKSTLTGDFYLRKIKKIQQIIQKKDQKWLIKKHYIIYRTTIFNDIVFER